MVTEVELFESPDRLPLDFCLWVWMKREVYKRKLDTRDELIARILDAADRIEKREDQLRRKTRVLRSRFSKNIEADVGVFKYLLSTVTNLYLKLSN
jgi:hypothetical protein